MEIAAAANSRSHLLPSPSQFTEATAKPLVTSLPCLRSPHQYSRSPLRQSRGLMLVVAASKRVDGDKNDPTPSTSSSFSAGRMVDQAMPVLRKRIHEVEMAEGTHDEAPEEWSEWERSYYVSYGSDVCAAVGFLQVFLLAARPAVAIGVSALVALSLPVSLGAVAVALLQGAKAVGVGMGLR